MKHLFGVLLAGFMLCGTVSNAQSFSIHKDTTYLFGDGDVSVENNITVTGPDTVKVQWRIISSTLPATWMDSLGVCDTKQCYGSGDIWPAVIKTASYPTGTHDFHVTLNMGSFSVGGPYVLRIKLNNEVNTSDTQVQTYFVTRVPTSVPAIKNSNEVSLYPNPASNTLNVVYDAAADIQHIAIYNIIGRQMSMFRVTDDNSASLNIDHLPTGVYFVRLLNGHGDVTATRKFTSNN